VDHLSKCLHVVLCSHFQHGAATAHTDVVLNELYTCAVQRLDLEVLSQGADGEHVVWCQVALGSIAEAQYSLESC